MKSSRSRFRRNSLLLVACWAVATSLAAAAPQAPAKPDEHPSFPAGEGRDLTLRVCSQCHDPEMASDQQNDEKGWKATVDLMAGKGAEATDAEFEQIVRYLAQAFPAK